MTTPETSFPVNPDELIKILSDNIPAEIFNTGLMSDDILQVIKHGDWFLTISYREPKITGIWLEGLANALVVPLPGLILARQHNRNGAVGDYLLAAVTEKPNPETYLYRAPLPNTSSMGICWGTVKKNHISPENQHSMKQDWEQLLGSSFGNHSLSGSSKSNPDDIRQMLLKLDKAKARKYPVKDLVPLATKNNPHNPKNDLITYEEWVSQIMKRGRY
jgi:hypothetical protein